MLRPESRASRLLALVVSALAVVVALVAAEIVLRLMIGSSNVDLFVYRGDTARVKLMRPNVRATVYGQPIETNGSGFRARREYVRDKPAGVRRIVVLGDSFTVSAGVPFEDIATTRLEAALNQDFGVTRVEVYNLGVGGHELLHHLATVKEIALGYRPDLALLLLFPYNDFETSTYDLHRKQAEADARGLSLDGDATRWERWRDSLYLMGLLRGGGSNLKWLAYRLPLVKRFVGPSSHDQLVARLTTASPQRERSITALREIREAFRTAAVPIHVYLLPANFGNYDLQRPFYDAAAHIVEDAGFPVWSLLGDFAATGRAPQEFRVNMIDSHPDVEYNALAQRFILQHLRESGVMDPWVAPPGRGATAPLARDGALTARRSGG